MNPTKEQMEHYTQTLRDVCANPNKAERLLFAIQNTGPMMRSVFDNIRLDQRQGIETHPTSISAARVTLQRAIALIDGDIDEVLKLQAEGDRITEEHDAWAHEQNAKIRKEVV